MTDKIKPMKALSMTQPWASLVAKGAKKWETRSWATNHRGPLAIHAAKGFPRSAKELLRDVTFQNALGSSNWRYLLESTLPCGVVLCIVDVLDCVPTEGIRTIIDPAERLFGDYSPGRYAWKLKLVEVFPEPIPAKGALSLWDWNRETAALEQTKGGENT